MRLKVPRFVGYVRRGPGEALRYIELAPKYWSQTRTRLDPVELANEVGPLTIPPAPQEQSPSS